MEQLSVLLANFGYTKPLPKYKRLEGVEKSFIEWITSELQQCASLTGERKTRFDDMIRKGRCYDDTEKTQILLKTTNNTKQLKEDITEQRENIQPLREHLQTLNTVHTTLSSEYKECYTEQERLTRTLINCQKEYAATTEHIKTLNTKMNGSLGRLQRAVETVIKTYRDDHTHIVTPISLSSCSQSMYHKMESNYLKELTNYTKKQFSPGINELMNTLSCDDIIIDTTIIDGCGPVDGCGQDEDRVTYERQRQELQRLQAIIPICEFQLVNNQVKMAYVSEAIKKVEEEILLMKRKRKDTREISIQFMGDNIIETKQQLQYCTNNRLIPLIEDSVVLHTSHVLSSNHDNKLFKQQLFINKQDEVIKFLNYQQSRYQLLSMLLEADYNRHRNNHQLLLATREQLDKWHLNNTTKIDNFKSIEASLDDDSFVSQGHDSVLQIVSQTNDSVSLKENTILSFVNRQKELVNKGISLYTDVRCHVYTSEDEANITFKPAVYERYVDNLEVVLRTLEEKLKILLKDHDQKKKALHHNPLLVTERSMFVQFFINPSHLVHLLKDLTTKIDSRAITNNTIHSMM